MTWGWLDFAISASERLAAVGPDGLKLPLLVALAGDEKLVDNAASRAFAARHSDVRLIEVAGAFHEILMETDDRRAVFWAAFDRMTAEVLDR